MKIFAHRGYSSKYPENTMLSFKKAIEFGCDGIECDVQITKDGKAVVIHDESVDRTSNGEGFVKDFTYEELLQLDFSYEKKFNSIADCNFKDNKIPLLSELLTLCKETNTLLNIELKNSIIDYKDLEQIVLSEVKKYGDYNNTIYSSFNHESIKRLNKLDNSIKAAPLLEDEIPNLDKYIVSLGSHGVHPGIIHLDKKLEQAIQFLKSKNFYINFYTVNDFTLAKCLHDLKVDGIFTDKCAEMKLYFSKR